MGITAWVERQPATTSRGWRNVRLWSPSPPVAEGWALRCAISGRALHHRKATKVACLIITTLHLRSCAGIAACRRDERRCNSPPREGLQPCVAPYFATLGRGDMRGDGDVPLKSHPGGGAGLSFPPWCCIVLCVNVVLCDDSLPPPPGWHHIYAYRLSPHVADAQVGEIRGYARRQPPPGVGEMSTFGRRLRRWRRGGRFAAPNCCAI